VLYVNGIALGVMELKRSTVSVTEGIRQNLDNQQAVSSSASSPPCNW
jgi:type I restriction enzyme R subunit